MAAKKKMDFALPRPKVDCAHDTCKAPAILREQTPLGFANFCFQHYKQYHRERAALACKERGLDTVEKQKAYYRQMLKRWQ